MRFADNLKAAMDLRGLTQAQIAQKAGLAQSHVSMLLWGKRVPGVDVAARLARALEVSLDWLCDVEPPDPGSLTPEEQQLLAYYRQGKEAGLGDIMLNTLRALTGK